MGDASADTLPKLLIERARNDADRTAIREKGYGIWQSWMWREVAANVRDMALGLHDLGLRRAMVAIVGDKPPASVLGHGRRSVDGRGVGAAVPGRGRRGDADQGSPP